MSERVESSSEPQRAGVLVEPSWLRDRSGTERVRIVDLREADAWAEGHVPGAVHLELAALGTSSSGCDNTLLEAKEFEVLMEGLGISNGDTVVAYDDQWGLAAARLVWALNAHGHEDASVLNGGWERWVAEGGAADTGGAATLPGRFTARIEPRVRADFDWIAAHADDVGVAFLDTRTPGEFAGGHVTRARCWDWFNAPPVDGWDAARPVAELLESWAELGVRPSQEVVVYCRSGMRAAHTYVVLKHAGFPRVRLYDGSWQDWSTRAGAPR